MKKQIQFAQKAVVFKQEDEKIFMLLVKYDRYKYKSTTKKLSFKYGCPGGRISFGEDLDKSLIRECLEETGVTIKPQDPLGLARWQVEKKDEKNDIIVVFRICKLVKDQKKGRVKDEADIQKSEWVNIDTFDFDKKVGDSELDIVKKAVNLVKKKSAQQTTN